MKNTNQAKNLTQGLFRAVRSAFYVKQTRKRIMGVLVFLSFMVSNLMLAIPVDASSVVHDSEGEFDAGSYSTTEYAVRGEDSESSVHLTGTGNYDTSSNTKLFLEASGDPTTPFVDDSPSHRALTGSGTAAISSTQQKFGDTSLYNPGSGVVCAADSDDFYFSNNSFTVDFWANSTNWSSFRPTLYSQFVNSSDYHAFMYGYPNATDLTFIVNGVVVLSGTWTPSNNNWYHLALVRDVNAWNIYVDGTSIASTTNSGTLGNIAASACIGALYNSTQTLIGYIDNFRVTKGEALWTSNFTPPGDVTSTDSNTKLLARGEGIDQAKVFVDSSPSARAITKVGSPVLSSTEYKYGETSAYMTGTTGLCAADSDDFDIAANDFTIDVWLNASSWSGIRSIYSQRLSSSNNIEFVRGFPAATDLAFLINDGTIVKGTWNPSINTWYHIALVRNGNTWTIYIDGTALATATNSSTVANRAASACVGTLTSAGSNVFSGYIDNFRFTNGEALWTENFTPGDVTSTNSNTKLLLLAEGIDQLKVFTDTSPSARNITRYGGSYISNVDSKFGGTSAFFSGDSAICAEDSDDFYTGSNDFTIDMWVNADSWAGVKSLYGQRNSSSDNIEFVRGFPAATDLAFMLNDGVKVKGTWNPSINTWYHIAVVRSGNDWSIYIDGTLLATASSTTALPNKTAKVCIGAIMSGGGSPFAGYIDNFRFTNGEALWTTSFTPPNLSDMVYETSGTYTSSVIDGGVANVDWETLVPSSDLPTDTSILYETRTGAIASPDGTWSSWQSVSGTTIASANAQYLQYRASFSTTDTAASPAVYSVSVNYSQIVDGDPPAVSSVQCSGQTATGFTVTWTTDEAADSAVDYDTDTGAPYASNSTNASLVTSHSVTLSNLTPSTTYYYRVRSSDAATNEATSAESTCDTTASAPTTVPAQVTISGTQPPVEGGNPTTVSAMNMSPTILDGDGVKKVELLLDGAVYHTCEFSSPYPTSPTCSYSYGTLPRGDYTLTTRVTDSLDNVTDTDEDFTVAGFTTESSVTASRSQAGSTGVDFELSFALAGTSGAADDLIIEFPAGFTVVSVGTSASTSACITGLTMTDSDTVTGTKSSCPANTPLTAAGMVIDLPSTPGMYEILWSNDYGGAPFYVNDDDQVTVSSNVDPSISFNVGATDSCDHTFSGNGGTVALGTLTPSAVTSSDASGVYGICTRMSHNATLGAVVTVRSLYAALTSLSVPLDTVPATSGLLAAGTEGYGLCSGSEAGHSGVDPSVPLSALPDDTAGDFDLTCTSTDHNVGQLTTSAKHLWQTDGPTRNAYQRLLLKAAISVLTEAHDDYSDTLTFVMTATY